MFTGLIEDTGVVVGLASGGMAELEVLAGKAALGVEIGDSVAVNGVCLTVSEKKRPGADDADIYAANGLDAELLVFNAMPETLRRTALGSLGEGSLVNLERAMSTESRFGGHIVQGHVDGVGEVFNVRPEGDAEIWELGAPEEVLRYTVEKGSACVDGISLTVVSVGETSFTVSILPQTREKTNLRELRPGDRVNLEADVIGKYVERLLGPQIGQKFERSIRDAI